MILAAAAMAAGISHAATPIPPGKWSFVFKDAKGHPDRPIRVYTFRPRTCDTKCPILFVMHGVKRNASDYRDTWQEHAERHNLLIVAPELAQKDWPRAANYNLGGVAENANPEKWTFAVIEHLFDEMRDGQADYAIFGHSAGGQFVHRMLLMRPDSRVSVYIAGNPGWYAIPEWRKEKSQAAYPYSLVGSKSGEAEVRKALGKRLVLLLGENDNDPDDENLNKSDGAMKQGAGRVDRGENFFKSASAIAGELGVKLGWELVEVPNTAHDSAGIAKAAAAAVYGKK
jgi:pimeloyl-ACP methyl ester carboxylesterase